MTPPADGVQARRPRVRLWPVVVTDLLALALDAVVAGRIEQGPLYVALSSVPLLLAVVVVPLAVVGGTESGKAVQGRDVRPRGLQA